MVTEIKPIREIPFLKDYVKAKPIYDGYSDDIKYQVWCNDKQYILKLSSLSLENEKKQELRNVKSIKKAAIAHAYQAGSVKDYSYIIYEYIPGVNGNIGIKTLTLDKQYEMGFKSGEILKAIHKVTSEVEKSQFKEKSLEKIKRIKESGIEIPFLDRLIEIFNSSCDSVLEKGVCLCHTDYHTGNMIVDGNTITAIDFNRSRFDSPFLDFKRLFSFSRAVSIPYCRGELDGYFGRKLTEEDFKDMLPFLAMDMIGFFLADKELSYCKSIYKMVLEDFNNFELNIPLWYY